MNILKKITYYLFAISFYLFALYVNTPFIGSNMVLTCVHLHIAYIRYRGCHIGNLSKQCIVLATIYTVTSLCKRIVNEHFLAFRGGTYLSSTDPIHRLSSELSLVNADKCWYNAGYITSGDPCHAELILENIEICLHLWSFVRHEIIKCLSDIFCRVCEWE